MLNVRSTPTPWAMRRTVKFAPAPPLLRRMTTPSKTWVRSRSPSTTFALDLDGVAGPECLEFGVVGEFDEVADIHSGSSVAGAELHCKGRGPRDALHGRRLWPGPQGR